MNIERGLIRFTTRISDAREARKALRKERKESGENAKEVILATATELVRSSYATADPKRETRTYTGTHETPEGPKKVRVIEKKLPTDYEWQRARKITVVGNDGFKATSTRRTKSGDEKGKIRVRGTAPENLAEILLNIKSA
jgi:hypothetical protein